MNGVNTMSEVCDINELRNSCINLNKSSQELRDNFGSRENVFYKIGETFESSRKLIDVVYKITQEQEKRIEKIESQLKSIEKK
jgi:hypothetical protein